MDLNKNAFTSYSESTTLLERSNKNNDLVIKGSSLGSIKCRLFIVVIFLFLLALCVAVGVTLGVFLVNKNKVEPRDKSNVEEFDKAAVATDAEACSTVGADVLRKGGSAVDAAVASTFCVGVVNLQSTGIGGGGFMVLYNGGGNRSTVMFDFREVAPSNITDETMDEYINNDKSTVLGGLAVGVPGQVKGLYEAWRRYGKRNWRELLEPSIDLASNGFTVSRATALAIDSVKETLIDDRFRELRKTLAPNGEYLKEGDILKQEPLAETLRNIASNGSDYFYKSSFTSQIVQDLQDDGSVLTEEDFKDYEVKIREVVTSRYGEYTVHGTTLPGGGPVVALSFNILNGFNISSKDFRDDPILCYHRLIEAFKFAYGQRLRLGDPDYNETIREVLKYVLDPATAEEMRSLISDNTTYDPSYYIDDLQYNPLTRGTSHLSVYAENGDTVVITTTINTLFGSKLSSKTGVIFNNEMDDFSVQGRNNSFGYPPSPANYIRPGHRPLSSMSPTVITRGDKVVLALGASGGSMIPTAVSQIMMDILSFNQTLSVASPYPRLHDQLLPDALLYEPNFPGDVVRGLEAKGHNVVDSSRAAVVQAIHVYGGKIHAASDVRKGGKPDGY